MGGRYLNLNYTIWKRGILLNWETKYIVQSICEFIAIHNSAKLLILLRNPKVRIISMHPMHPLIFEYHPGQSPRPFE